MTIQYVSTKPLTSSLLAAALGAFLMPADVPAAPPDDIAEEMGFERELNWRRDQEELTTCVVIPAADPEGVRINGVQSGDVVKVAGVDGIASFAGKNWYHKAKGIIKIVLGSLLEDSEDYYEYESFEEAVKEKLGDEYVPLLKKSLKELEGRRKYRNGYGEDLDGDFKGGEGGIIVAMPSAGEPVHRGKYKNSRGEKVKYEVPGGTRRDYRLSEDLQGKAFFPVPGDETHNTRRAKRDGSVYVLAWDKHGTHEKDNRGMYVACVELERSS